MRLWSLSGVLILLVAASCGKEGGGNGPQGGSGAAGPIAASGRNPRDDYSKPYLTDQKVEKLLVAMKDGDNPLKSALGAAGMLSARGNYKADMEKLDATARKYGFEGFEDYAAVWGRVTVAQMEVWGKKLATESTEMFKKSIASAEASLKDPGLSPEMREMYESQITGYREALQGMQGVEKSQLSEADMAVYNKYAAQIEAVTKDAQAAALKAAAAKDALESGEEPSEEEGPIEEE